MSEELTNWAHNHRAALLLLFVILWWCAYITVMEIRHRIAERRHAGRSERQ